MAQRTEVGQGSPFDSRGNFPKSLTGGIFRVEVNGGDGAVSRAIQDIYDRGLQNDVVVGINPMGTQDVLSRRLKKVGAIMTPEEFMDTSVGEFPDKRFKPGVVGGKVTVVNQFARGDFERANGKWNERLRGKVPKFLRPTLARVAGSISASITGKEMMDIYSVTSHIGKVNAFPDLDTFGDEIAHGTITGDTNIQVAKLNLTLFSWFAGIRPPKAVFAALKGREMLVEAHEPDVWIDGDTKPNPIQDHGPEIMARAGVAVSMVALVPAKR